MLGGMCLVALAGTSAAASGVFESAGCEGVHGAASDLRRTQHIPVLAVAVVLPMGDCLQTLSGPDDLEHPRADAHARFSAASLSKLLTAVAVMQLVERKTIDLDGPLERYLPQFAGRGILIEHLLTHSAGLADRRRPANRKGPAEVTEYLEQTAGSRPAYPPGKGWGYTDAAFNVLGAVVESVTGTPFPAHMRAHVLAPLGMSESTFDPRTLEPGAIAPPHHRGWFGVRRSRSDWDLAFAPSSGLHASITDLARFARFSLSEGELDGVRLLEADTVRAMWQPRVHTRWPGVRLGLAWQVREWLGHRVIQHAGSDSGYQSLLTLYPDDGFAIVSVANVDEWPRFELHESVAASVISASRKKAGDPVLHGAREGVGPPGSAAGRPDARGASASAFVEGLCGSTGDVTVSVAAAGDGGGHAVAKAAWSSRRLRPAR